ncbi:DUF1905 domain-containing protein [Glaciihabitans sp. INWT7]|uniref:DUF1905 domain-containing protein n=1 Tax=Glaciihabitans sp. INWT7 TaxID=2596912 RepID=UPI0016297A13|nr:DUF1905 domain-containing protein [Glaciihabitans sp. INWT7]QNE46400.1 DUF1905 domain-containing protein [Glaciihabitans sp. INWT7]
MTDVRPLDHTFTTVLQGNMGPNNWTCAIMADSLATLGTGKAIKVVATVEGNTFTTSMLPHKGGHMLPIRKSLQDAIGKHAGDTVTVHLGELQD